MAAKNSLLSGLNKFLFSSSSNNSMGLWILSSTPTGICCLHINFNSISSRSVISFDSAKSFRRYGSMFLEELAVMSWVIQVLWELVIAIRILLSINFTAVKRTLPSNSSNFSLDSDRWGHQNLELFSHFQEFLQRVSQWQKQWAWLVNWHSASSFRVPLSIRFVIQRWRLVD